MISRDISENKETIKNSYHNSGDLIAYEFETISNIKMLICYIEGFIDRKILNDDILKPLVIGLKDKKDIKKLIFNTKVQEESSMERIINELNNGKVGLFIEGEKIAYLIELSSWVKRNIEKPGAESVVRGPKEGFIEDISVNKVLLRKIIRNSNLVYEDYILGTQTKTTISLAYIKGIVNEKVLEEVRKRISIINIDAIIESGNIEELIEDHPRALFSTISNAEKPDVVAAKILEGRVAILTDGTPHVLVVPKLFIEGLLTSEDYYLRPHYATFLRALRYISFFTAIYLPGIFVALQLYHQEMIPTTLLISAAGAREGVPLPAALEVFIMIMALELTKESGLRLPKSIGMTVSIVGALILGQAAVQAGIVSGLTVIIVSIAAIAEFTIPEFTHGIVISRIIILILGALAGIFGITIGFMIFTVHILTLESFGVPFGWPIAPMDWEGFKKDTFTRAPIWKMIYRPKALRGNNIKRQVPPRKM
ncbi:MAG TPA: spore germination protein [Tissierellaceae bacterium]